MAKTYKIHPSIGVARLGTSNEVYVGPELVGTYAKPASGGYRDIAGNLKRQATRFWVFEYDDAAGTAVPIKPGVGGVAQIEWTVHLRNKKAVWFDFQGIVGEGPAGYPAGHPLRNPSVTANRDRLLVIDPGPRTLVASGATLTHEISKGSSPTPAAESWPPPLNGGAKSISSLGTLLVDGEGRLTVAGGYGISGTTGALPPGGNLNFDDNDGWFDDTSDGSVVARIFFDNGTNEPAEGAWVAIAPPDFAPPVENLVTVFDLLYDLGLRKFDLDPAIHSGGAFLTSFQPSFTRDIYPVLRRALDYQWVIAEAEVHAVTGRFNIPLLADPPAPGETPATNPRDRVFRRLRNPDALTAGGLRTMPKLFNDGVDGAPTNSLRFTVTRFQFFAMQQWAAGAFISDWTGPPAPQTKVTADGLDRAALDAGAGGSFFPGMEMSWILRDERVFKTPFDFRFNELTVEGPNGLTPGDATKRMAIPWQADFLECAANWWPAQRPNQVLVGATREEWDRSVTSHVHLTDVWSQLGVVAEDLANPGQFIETERTLP